MARMSIEIGGAVAEIETPDAQAAAVVDGYVSAYCGQSDMNEKQRLQWFLTHLASRASEVAAAYAIEAAVELERVRLKTQNVIAKWSVTAEQPEKPEEKDSGTMKATVPE